MNAATVIAGRRQSSAYLTAGPACPTAELANIFRPFYRVADARDRDSGGVGLGLAIADRVARIHGGTVRAENRAGGGLEVVMTIQARSDEVGAG